MITQHRAHFATWEVGQQLPWFPQEHSVRTAGPPSTQDIWCQTLPTSLADTEAATFAGTRHRKSQLARHRRTKQWSTSLKSSVVHYHVPCILMGKSSPASFALNDSSLSGGWTMHWHTLLLPAFTARCYAERDDATLGRLSVCLSVTFRCSGMIFTQITIPRK